MRLLNRRVENELKTSNDALYVLFQKHSIKKLLKALKHMLKILLILPPVISMVHVFLAILLYLFDIQYSGNLLVLFSLPIIVVTSIHIYIAIVDNSMSKNEHIGYALVHIPFSITFSFLALLFFIPKDNGQVDASINAKDTLIQCVDIREAECLKNFYQRTSSDLQRK